MSLLIATKSEFLERPLVWDPASNRWRTLNDCVWKSSIHLNCKFVLTSEYDESDISGLFDVHLKVPNVTIEFLTDELEYMQNAPNSEPVGAVRERATSIYALLRDMVKSAGDEERKWLR